MVLKKMVEARKAGSIFHASTKEGMGSVRSTGRSSLVFDEGSNNWGYKNLHVKGMEPWVGMQSAGQRTFLSVTARSGERSSESSSSQVFWNHGDLQITHGKVTAGGRAVPIEKVVGEIDPSHHGEDAHHFTFRFKVEGNRGGSKLQEISTDNRKGDAIITVVLPESQVAEVSRMIEKNPLGAKELIRGLHPEWEERFELHETPSEKVGIGEDNLELIAEVQRYLGVAPPEPASQPPPKKKGWFRK